MKLFNPFSEEAQEFGLMSQTILPIMKDPDASRELKRSTLDMMTKELSEKTFQKDFVADMIMEIINMKEEVCKEYEDTESQVNGILSWLPRMEYHRGKLTKAVSKNRKHYGLKV